MGIYDREESVGDAYDDVTAILATHQRDSMAGGVKYTGSLAIADAIYTLATVIRAGQISNT